MSVNCEKIIFSIKVENDLHFHYLILFHFWKGKTVKTAKKISVIYEDGAIAKHTAYKWFARFKKCKLVSGKPITF